MVKVVGFLGNPVFFYMALIDVASVIDHVQEYGLVSETSLVVRIGLVFLQQENIFALNKVKVVGFLGNLVFFHMVLVDVLLKQLMVLHLLVLVEDLK
jgi:hypothetical protein